MQFNDIFALSVDRHMDGVIKADASDYLFDELTEYVFTPDIKRSLQQFCDEYTSPHADGNGAWISGFYGSGKSHLLKILSYLLENAELKDDQGMGTGIFPLECMKQKLKDDSFLLSSLESACERIPSESILFKIGGKADTERRNDGQSLLFAFIKVLNERCGYFAGEQSFVAALERDLDREGLYEEFKQKCPDVIGREWTDVRSKPTMFAAKITRLYDLVTEQPEGTTPNIVDHYSRNYHPTPEDFAIWTREYIDKHGSGFRLNYFVDEMGQFIANSIELMYMLQEIAENLNTVCAGNSWVIVVSQEDMDKLTGKWGNEKAKDFTKIQARFKIKMKIPPNDANTVVKERLLKKSEEALPAIDKIYDKHNGNFKLLLDFPDGSRHYSTYASPQEFEETYPLVPYQFPMFHDALVGLSDHEAFTGEYVSTGARNMLATTRQVLKATKDAGQVENGDLVSFDMMFEGLRGDLKSEIVNAIDVVNEHMGDPLAVRILKALLLVKYTEGFEATPKNIKVLLLRSLKEDPTDLEERIEQSLLRLYNAHYVQREGEKYMYLTNEEQDIEKEIGREPVTDADVAKFLGKTLKEEVLNRTKITYRNANFSRVFDFNLSVDGNPIGQQNNDLSVHVFTDLHDFSVGNQCYANIKELRVLLGENKLLTSEARVYLQTNAYVPRNRSGAVGRKAEYLARKATDNESRRSECAALLKSMLDTALWGTCMEDISAEMRGQGADRLFYGVDVMVRKSYALLSCLTTPFDKNTVYRAATGTRLMDGESLPQYCEEILLEVKHILGQSSRCVIGGSAGNSLEACMKAGQYGWPAEAVRQGVGLLALNDRVECMRNDSPLEGANLATALSQGTKLEDVEVRISTAIDPKHVQRLKDAYQLITRMAPSKTDAKGLADDIKDYIEQRVSSYASTSQKAAVFPFGDIYAQRLADLVSISQRKRDWFIQSAPGAAQGIREALDELSSMAEFATQDAGQVFVNAASYLRQNASNLAGTHDTAGIIDELNQILENPDCHKDSSAPRAKRIVKELNAKVEEALQNAKSRAQADLEAFADQFRQGEYAQADDAAKGAADAVFQQCSDRICQATQISAIRSAVQDFKDTQSSRLYSLVAPPQSSELGADDPVPAPVKTVSFSSISVPARFKNKTLSTNDEVDVFIAALKEDLKSRIAGNEKIIL